MVPVHQVVRDTWNALLPISCVVCGQLDSDLCGRCYRSLQRPPVTVSLAVRRHLFDRPVIASGAYRGALRRTVLAFKDHGYTRLASPLGSLLAATYTPFANGPALLVPIPSSLRGWIRRGVEPTVLLANQLVHRHSELTVARALRRRAQALLGPVRKAMPRQQRLHTSPVFDVRGDVRGQRVWLLDDVATTGVTLETATRLLLDRGALVLGALVLAASSVREGGLSTETRSR